MLLGDASLFDAFVFSEQLGVQFQAAFFDFPCISEAGEFVFILSLFEAFAHNDLMLFELWCVFVFNKCGSLRVRLYQILKVFALVDFKLLNQLDHKRSETQILKKRNQILGEKLHQMST